jgi:hypothetical protein
MSNVDSLLPKPVTKEDRMTKKEILTIGSMQEFLCYLTCRRDIREEKMLQC